MRSQEYIRTMIYEICRRLKWVSRVLFTKFLFV
jgi:hypothetical protein